MNGADILRLPMPSNDAGATTIGEYLQALLTRLWMEGEGFNGKKPFGNSGWDDDLLGAVGEVQSDLSPQVLIELAIAAMVPAEPAVVQATPQVPILSEVEAVLEEMRSMRSATSGTNSPAMFMNEDDLGLIELRWRMPLSGGGDRVLDVEARLESAYLFDTHTETMTNLMKEWT